MNKDVFDGESWDLSDHDSTEGIGDAGVDANEGEGGIEGVVFVELDLEILVGLLGGVPEKERGKVLGRISQGSIHGLRLGGGRGNQWM